MSKNNVIKNIIVSVFLTSLVYFRHFYCLISFFNVLYHDIVLKLKPKFASRFLVHPSQANEKNTAENERPAKTWVA